MFRVVASVAFILTLSTPSICATIDAQCIGDSLRITLSANGDYADPAGRAFYVSTFVYGSCEPPRRINEEPIPYPRFGESIRVVLTAPAIDPNGYNDIALRLYDPASGHSTAPCDNYLLGEVCGHAVACSADAVFCRGRILFFSGGHSLAACAGHCWPGGVPLSFLYAAPGWEDYVNTGQIVNVYGTWIADREGRSHLDVSRVSLESDPAGCDATAQSSIEWGQLKTLYR